MEALFETLKIKVGEAAAKKLLGIDKQQGNPKYTFGMPFTGGKLQINWYSVCVVQPPLIWSVSSIPSQPIFSPYWLEKISVVLQV